MKVTDIDRLMVAATTTGLEPQFSLTPDGTPQRHGPTGDDGTIPPKLEEQTECRQVDCVGCQRDLHRRATGAIYIGGVID
jgi:hypothetical protein